MTRLSVSIRFATVVGAAVLLGLPAGSQRLSAGTPSVFTLSPGPPPIGNGLIGVAAAPSQLIVTEYCTGLVDQIDSLGTISPFSAIPTVSGCFERYIAIAPAGTGWTPNDVYVTDGPQVWKIPPGGGPASLFVTILSPLIPNTHTGNTFDKVGTFSGDMIVTGGGSGQVWRVTSAGAASCVLGPVALGCSGLAIGGFIEGPDVAPLAFGTVGGQVLVASESLSAVFAVSSAGGVTPVTGWPSAESIHFVPPVTCNFGSSGGAFFTAIYPVNITKFPSSDFTGLGGSALVTSEFTAGIGLITPAGLGFSVASFHGFIGQHEGSAFVDCAVPGKCVRTQGYWKTHAAAWPVTTLTLGTFGYTQAELLSILNRSVAGNGLVSLAHQLIAAKLNAATGASVPSAVLAALASADALIGGLVIPPVGSGFLAPSATSALTSTLDTYNQGLSLGGPTHCPE